MIYVPLAMKAVPSCFPQAGLEHASPAPKAWSLTTTPLSICLYLSLYKNNKKENFPEVQMYFEMKFVSDVSS